MLEKSDENVQRKRPIAAMDAKDPYFGKAISVSNIMSILNHASLTTHDDQINPLFATS